MSSTHLLPMALIAALVTVIPNVVAPTMLSKAHADQIAVRWDKNGGTVDAVGGSSTTSHLGFRFYGWENQFLVFPTPPTWEGHTFIGWFAKPVADQENCGIGSQGSCNSLEIRDGKLVFYARWSNSDSRLSALTLSSGTLSQPFASDIYSYAATVTNSVSSISITPTFIQANSTSVQHLLLEDETWDFDGSLSVGPNVV